LESWKVIHAFGAITGILWLQMHESTRLSSVFTLPENTCLPSRMLPINCAGV